jgi:hypothetical protein
MLVAGDTVTNRLVLQQSLVVSHFYHFLLSRAGRPWTAAGAQCDETLSVQMRAHIVDTAG